MQVAVSKAGRRFKGKAEADLCELAWSTWGVPGQPVLYIVRPCLKTTAAAAINQKVLQHFRHNA